MKHRGCRRRTEKRRKEGKMSNKQMRRKIGFVEKVKRVRRVT